MAYFLSPRNGVFMTEGVNNQATAEPEQKASSDKAYNFRMLEEAKEKEREARIRAETEKQMLQKELMEIKDLLKPKEVDPFDSDDIDPELKTRLEAKLAKERATYERKAEEIAEKTYQKKQTEKDEAKKKNYLQRLRETFSDYDSVVNENNILELSQKDPVFLETALEVPDDYKRREKTYHRIKSMKTAETSTPSVQEKVKDNQRNPYHVPSGGFATSTAIEFDVRSKDARERAYAALKKMQGRPIETKLARK